MGSRTVLLAVLMGPAVHLSVFQRGEWHLQAPILLGLWLAAAVLLAGGLIFEYHCYERLESHSPPWLVLSCAFVSWNCSLFLSIAVYRAFFHPLRRFPGPFMASVTKFWHIAQCLKQPQHRLLDDLYHRYGGVVRTGPRELMIVHPDIHWRLANAKDACDKTDWYDLLRPSRAIISARERDIHAPRRRLWERAMSTSNRRAYAQHIEAHTTRLVETIDEMMDAGSAVATHDLFSWFAFDIMGLFAFGKTFQMLNTRTYHRAALDLRRGMGALGVLSCMPWLARVAFAYIPGLWIVKDWFRLKRFCDLEIEERVHASRSNDVASHMIEAARANGLTQEDWQWLSGDGLTLIVAGSDTTAATLTFLFHELASRPEIVERLFQELVAVDVHDLAALRSLPLLNGVISETLRLHPAVPSGVYRETPSGGMMLDGTYIPGGTKVLAPRWTISRLESCFEDATRFNPERWFSTPQKIRHKAAYSPFGFGQWSCVGKNIALEEIMIVVSQLVHRYRFRLAPGTNGRAVEENMRDHVTAVPGELHLEFERRT